MEKRKRRRPSASMVIACIALFAALTGGAYAALSKNSVKSKQVKNGALLGEDLKKDTLTGKQIKEAKLKQVPSAASASAADSVGGMEVIHVEPFTLTNGGSQQILQSGAFTLTATCSINEGGSDFARVLIATTVANSAFDGDGTNEDLDPASLATDREYMVASSTTGNPSIDQESDGTAWAPDGTEIMGNDAFGAVNLPADGAGTCRFGGAFYVG
jgi:hypothetical protein